MMTVFLKKQKVKMCSFEPLNLMLTKIQAGTRWCEFLFLMLTKIHAGTRWCGFLFLMLTKKQAGTRWCEFLFLVLPRMSHSSVLMCTQALRRPLGRAIDCCRSCCFVE